MIAQIMDQLFTFKNISLALLLLITVAIVGSIIITSLKNSITPMPSSAAVAHIIVEETVKIMKDGIIVEAGSGWGLLSLKLARALPHCTIIGIENSLVPFLFSKLLHIIFKEKNLIFMKKDIYTFDYQNIDMIVCYLFPGAMKKLKAIFDDKLNKLKYLISNTFALPQTTPAAKITAHDLYQSLVYVYTNDKLKIKNSKQSSFKIY